MGKVGAPYGNKNAAGKRGGSKLGGAFGLGKNSSGFRMSGNKHQKVNYSSPGFLKAAAAQKRRGY